jgi:hypothetical protein
VKEVKEGKEGKEGKERGSGKKEEESALQVLDSIF